MGAVIIDVADSIDKAIQRLKDPKQTNATILKDIANDVGIGDQFSTKDYQSNKAAVAQAIVQSIGEIFNLSGSDMGATYQEESFTADPKPPIIKKAPRKKVTKKVTKEEVPADDFIPTILFEGDEWSVDTVNNTIIRLRDNFKVEDKNSKLFEEIMDRYNEEIKAAIETPKKEAPVTPSLEGQPPSDEWLAANAEGFDDDDAAIEAMLNEESEAEGNNEKADDLTDDIEDDLCIT